MSLWGSLFWFSSPAFLFHSPVFLVLSLVPRYKNKRLSIRLYAALLTGCPQGKHTTIRKPDLCWSLASRFDSPTNLVCVCSLQGFKQLLRIFHPKFMVTFYEEGQFVSRLISLYRGKQLGLKNIPAHFNICQIYFLNVHSDVHSWQDMKIPVTPHVHQNLALSASDFRYSRECIALSHV